MVVDEEVIAEIATVVVQPAVEETRIDVVLGIEEVTIVVAAVAETKIPSSQVNQGHKRIEWNLRSTRTALWKYLHLVEVRQDLVVRHQKY